MEYQVKKEKTMKTKLVSFIIPVYMNEGSIALTFVNISSLFKTLEKSYDFEVLFINDGSKDNSLNEIKELEAKFTEVKYLSFSRNFGQVPAIIAGAKYCKGDVSIIMSADMQDPISLIHEMLSEWENGNKIVIGTRKDREDNFLSQITSKIFYSLMHYGNNKIPQGGFDYILMDRNALDEYNKIDERNRFLQGDILWLGFPLKFISYKRLKREIGKSQWTFSKKLKYFIDGWINTSYFPIRMFSLLGLTSSILGFIYTLLIIYNRFFNNIPFKGWAPIMILILLIGGMIMLMLGIIGEYIWRIYDETRNRKVFIIEEMEIE